MWSSLTTSQARATRRARWEFRGSVPLCRWAPSVRSHTRRRRHPDILVGADRLVATPIHLIEFSGDSAVQMLDRRDTRRDHLERRIKGVEVKVDVPHHHAGDEPQFERHVRRAELHRCQSDMVVAVDKPRQHYLVAGADYRHVRMSPAEVRVRADLDDCAVFLQHGAVGDLVPTVAVDRMRHQGATADQRCGHVEPPHRRRWIIAYRWLKTTPTGPVTPASHDIASAGRDGYF